MNGLLRTGRTGTSAARALQTVLLLLLPIAALGEPTEDGELSARELGKARVAFLKCRACHAVSGEDSAGKLGPSLQGVFGRQAGSSADYPNYSPALREAEFVWDTAKMESFLADPAALIPGNLMAFPGIEDAGERVLLVRYLRHLTDRED